MLLKQLEAYKRRTTYTYVPEIARSAMLTIIHMIGTQLPLIKRTLPPKVEEWRVNVNFDSYLMNTLIPELLVLGESYTFVEPTYIESVKNYNMLSSDITNETLMYKVAKARASNDWGLPDMVDDFFRYWRDGEWIEVSEAGKLVAGGTSEVFPLVHGSMPYSLMASNLSIPSSSLNLNSVDIDYLNRSGFPILTVQIQEDEDGQPVVVGHWQWNGLCRRK